MAKNNLKSHVIGLIFKALCALFILTVVGILVWRMVSMNVPTSMKTIIATDEINNVYSESGELNIFTQKQGEITEAENCYGYFSIPHAIFVEDTNQAQIVFRYNNSTIKHLKEDYKLPSLPNRDDDLYDVTLVVVYDLTPDDDTDNLKVNEGVSTHSVRIHPTDKYTKSEQKSLYNFRKFVFDGVETGDKVLAIYADFYYNNDIDYEREPYGSLCIYDYITEREEYSLTRKDIKELEK